MTTPDAPRLEREHAKRQLARLVLALLVIFALVVFVQVGGGARVISTLVPGDCTVGVNGAAVSIQITGGGASDACDAQAAVTHWYRYEGGTQPAGAVICQWRQSGRVYTVRDQGALNMYATQVCSSH